MDLLKLLIVLLSVHAQAILSANDFENGSGTGIESVHSSYLNFSYQAIHRLAARSPNPDQDPAFQPPDWSNPGILISDNGPMLRSNWEPDHCAEKVRVSAAFYQALLLARTALDYLDANLNSPGDSYQRYFAGQSIVTVRNVFSMFFNPDYRYGNPVSDITSWKFLFMGEQSRPPYSLPIFGYCPTHCNHHSASSLRTKSMTDIRYGAPVRGTSYGQYDTSCLTGSGQTGATIQGYHIAPGIVSDDRRALLILCPEAFRAAIPDLPLEPLDPSNDPRCVTMRQNLYNSFELDTLASTILHELFHWDYLMGPATQQEHIADYKASTDPSNTDGDPSNGYGPYNAFRMAARNRNTILNADSYVQFAV